MRRLVRFESVSAVSVKAEEESTAAARRRSANLFKTQPAETAITESLLSLCLVNKQPGLFMFTVSPLNLKILKYLCSLNLVNATL